MENNFEQRAATKFCCKVGFMAAKMWENFLKAFSDSSMLRATVFRWHSRFAAGEKSTEDAEWSGRPRTIKTNENITSMAAVLKDCSASCTITAESRGYQKPLSIAFYLMISKMKTVCMICATWVDSRTMGTACCSRKRLNHLVFSCFESVRLFYVSEVENGVQGGPICNHKRHSDICNDKTEDYSYYWFFMSNASVGRSHQPVYCS